LIRQLAGEKENAQAAIINLWG